MTRRQEAQQIIEEIRYQLCPYPTTRGACFCGNGTSRGGRRCHPCLVKDLSELVGDMEVAFDLSRKMDLFLRAERDIIHLVEKQGVDDAQRRRND